MARYQSLLVAGVSTLLLLLSSVHESVASTSSGHSNFRHAATTRFLQEDEDGDAVTTTTVNTTDIAANATIIPDTCPPCPQCSATTGIDGEILEEGDYPDDPLTLQILVVDSPGIITMGEWKCPVCRLRHLPPFLFMLGFEDSHYVCSPFLLRLLHDKF